MKKLFYLTMFLSAIIGICFMIFTPIYKFDEEKISKNNTETVAMLLDESSYLYYYRDNSDQVELTKEALDEYKKNYYLYNQKAYAILTKNIDIFYEVNAYEVLNKLYKDKLAKEGPLDINSTTEEVKLLEKTLIDLLGEADFNTLKEAEINKEITKYNDLIIKTVKESMEFNTLKEAEDFLIKNAKQIICDEFLVLFVGYDEFLIDESIEEITTKGIKLKHLFNSISNAFKIDKAVWQKEKYHELKFFKKVKAVINDHNFYNPIPLLILFAIIVEIFIGLILLILKGLKGMRGIRYPHAFISSIINGSFCLALLIGPAFIPNNYFLKYHFTEFTRLLEMIRFGNFSTAIVIALFVYMIALGISVFGRFFRWGKRKKQEN